MEQPETEPNKSEIDALSALYKQRQFEAVLAKGGELAVRHPGSAALQNILGFTNAALQRQDAARIHYERAIELDPLHANAHNNLATLLNGMGQTEAALEIYRRAIEIKPDLVNAHFNMGNALKKLGRAEEACAAYEQALAIQPELVPALNNLGNTLKDLKRPSEAVGYFERVIRLQPDAVDPHYNLGLALADLKRLKEAVASFERAVALKPDHVDAWIGLGRACADIEERTRMIAAFEKALQIQPGNDAFRAEKIHQQAHICDWDGLAAEADVIPLLGIRADPVDAYSTLVTQDDPPSNRARAQNLARKKFGALERRPIERPTTRPERLRIGYFSADFHDHAVMNILVRMFELHDRERFEVHAFSFGPDKKIAMRDRLKDAFDAFHEVRDMDASQIADLARHEQIDIAIDLMGYTRGMKPEIFARGAAPVQISYMGFPGTSGTAFLDYIISDHIVIPEGQRAHYSEQIIYLPETYQGNDDTKVDSNRPMTRAQVGLPENGFVFCCFNNSFKITPAEFDIWMRLLAKVDGSVLWLLDANPWMKDNLRREAGERGVDPERLIFGPKIPNADHLARLKLADLFLDCFVCNAHATASDALWAGVPVLTTPGKGFPARVGASLLLAVGLPELVASSREEYERIALDLATGKAKYAAVRSRLAANRKTMPLFASERFTRHMEDGYRQAYQRWFDGLEPAMIEVEKRD